MYRKSMLILLLIVLAVAGGTYYGCYMQEKESIQLDAASQAVSQEDRAEITVYVTGAINKPGVVTVREGARMADAVKACGGLLPTADGEKVNMAQVLKDGQQVRVPEKQAGSSALPGKYRQGIICSQDKGGRPHQYQHGQRGGARCAAWHRPRHGQAHHRVPRDGGSFHRNRGHQESQGHR